MVTPVIPSWFKSTYSGGSGTECVECAHAVDGMLVRDSKRSEGPVLLLQGSSWRAFTQALREGELEG
ncbi:hypothetical protein GCM10010129_14050 [Streptomyces fumigatiscleroticus]|nr:hypothetical protein GCM10010129_14050 [Streptomyces fumigatiscleroticus]